MKTPTKEQINELYKQGAGSCACDNAFDICHLTPMQIKDVVIKWEKIKDWPDPSKVCTKKKCWYYCDTNSDGCYLAKLYQNRPKCFVSHKKAKEFYARKR